MTDIRALQIMLDAGVTDPPVLFAALPSGTTEDTGRAIRVLSEQALADERPAPRCGGSGELVEHLTPNRDHRDPDNVTREYECPGCPDCDVDVVYERAALRWGMDGRGAL